MYEQRTRGDFSSTLDRDADVREQVAVQLSQEAIHQFQRGIVGLLALPASAALGLAATVSYASAFLERGFEAFESSLGRLTQGADRRPSSEQILPGRIEEPSTEKTKSARS